MKRDLLSMLKEVRKLVKAGWCRATPAKDRWGRECSATSPKACKFCVTGAVRHLVGETTFDTPGQAQYERVITLIAKHCPPTGWRQGWQSIPSVEVQAFNDYAKSKRHVIKLLDKVIASIKPRGH